MAMQTVTDVKSSLDDLKNAVNAVSKADKAWLAALEGFFELINPDDTTQETVNEKIAAAVAKILPPGLQKIEPPGSDLSPKQAVRLVLDEISFLQFADKKLGGRVSRADSTSEGLGRAVVEAEAYLVMTDEAFELLTKVCAGVNPSTGIENIGEIDNIPGIDSHFRSNLTKLRQSAQTARTSLSSQVNALLQQTTAVVALPPTEPEGTDLLLGKKLSSCDLTFLAQIPSTSKEFNQTVTLLEGGHLKLSNSQIRKLINSWEKAVKNFVQAKTPTNAGQIVEQEFGSLDTIAGFLCVHNVLDTLYDRLETEVTRTVEIISTDI